MQTIYILNDPATNFIKIGKATDLQQRITNLQTANPRLILLFSVKSKFASEIEAYVHTRLAVHRQQGEFFNVNQQLAIDEIRDALSVFELRPDPESVEEIASYHDLSPSRPANANEELILQELLNVRADLEKLAIKEKVLI